VKQQILKSPDGNIMIDDHGMVQNVLRLNVILFFLTPRHGVPHTLMTEVNE